MTNQELREIIKECINELKNPLLDKLNDIGNSFGFGYEYSSNYIDSEILTFKYNKFGDDKKYAGYINIEITNNGELKNFSVNKHLSKNILGSSKSQSFKDDAKEFYKKIKKELPKYSSPKEETNSNYNMVNDFFKHQDKVDKSFNR